MSDQETSDAASREDDLRASFEAWQRSRYVTDLAREPPGPWNEDRYVRPYVQGAWEAWNAHAKLTNPPAGSSPTGGVETRGASADADRAGRLSPSPAVSAADAATITSRAALWLAADHETMPGSSALENLEKAVINNKRRPYWNAEFRRRAEELFAYALVAGAGTANTPQAGEVREDRRSEWQSITTAPRDGRSLLLWAEAWEMTWGVQVGAYDHGSWLCGDGKVAEDAEDEFGSTAPTHWMPMPRPPALGTDARQGRDEGSVHEHAVVAAATPEPDPRQDPQNGTGEAGVALETFETIAQWGAETFGPITPARIAQRAGEEMRELDEDPERVEEAADVLICLARYPGLWAEVERKMAINRARKWNLRGDGTGYHVKEPTPPPTDQSPGDVREGIARVIREAAKTSKRSFAPEDYADALITAGYGPNQAPSDQGRQDGWLADPDVRSAIHENARAMREAKALTAAPSDQGQGGPAHES